MTKIEVSYIPLSKEEQDKFDKSQQEFYEKYIKHRKEKRYDRMENGQEEPLGTHVD